MDVLWNSARVTFGYARVYFQVYEYFLVFDFLYFENFVLDKFLYFSEFGFQEYTSTRWSRWLTNLLAASYFKTRPSSLVCTLIG